MACPLVLCLHHPSLLPPRPLTLLSSHKPCCQRHADCLHFASCATRACRLDSHHSNVIWHAPHHPFALYIAAWVCPLSCLVFACVQLSTGHWPMVNRANGPRSSLFFCNLYVPHSLIVPYLHRLYYILSASWVLLGGRPHSYTWTATMGPSFHTTTMHPNLLQTPTLHTSECVLTMSKLFVALASSTLHKVFCIGTAAIIPAMRIRWQHSISNSGTSVDMEAVEVKVVQGIMLPIVGGEDGIPHALWKHFVDVQERWVKWEGWGMPCTVADTEGPWASTTSTPTLRSNDTDTDTTS